MRFALYTDVQGGCQPFNEFGGSAKYWARFPGAGVANKAVARDLLAKKVTDANLSRNGLANPFKEQPHGGLDLSCPAGVLHCPDRELAGASSSLKRGPILSKN